MLNGPRLTRDVTHSMALRTWSDDGTARPLGEVAATRRCCGVRSCPR